MRRTHHNDDLKRVFDDGIRIILKNWDGTVAFNGTVWLFKKCFERGWFVNN